MKKTNVIIEVIDDNQWLITIKLGRIVIGKKCFQGCPDKDVLSNYINNCKENYKKELDK